MPVKKQADIEFMKQEYTGICQAFGDLYNVILKVFNFYLLLASVPFTLAAIIYKTLPTQFDLKDLPMPMSVLFPAVSIIGLFTTFSMIHLRMEQVLYARTVNCIRRYFCETDTSRAKTIDNYLSLPTTDQSPPFFESGRAFFWQIIIIGFVDALYLLIGLIKFSGLSLCLSWFFIGLFFLLHILSYKRIALVRERNYKVKCPPIPHRNENY